MNRVTVRRLVFVVVGLVLLFTPLIVRTVFLGYNQRTYTAADSAPPNLAATPNPTATPEIEMVSSEPLEHELRPGAVIIDMAHGNRLSRNQFEPLSAALANRGIGVRFWMSNVDPMAVTSFLDYPDQSEDLETLLHGASGLVTVSPFFMWTPEEIAVAEKFVADGGRLLIISDPDVAGDMARDVNTLGEPFGVVFNDDYLYDTVDNDENYIYVFPTEFENSAQDLQDNRIALYGSRSIGGDITPQIRTAHTTLSSVRVGVTEFPVMVTGGLESRGTKGGVLALGDFDVLTAPFVERHDNALLNTFVADFLSSGERIMGITDFPEFLGKQVKLIIANGAAVDSATLQETSKLQRSLEMTGRQLSVGGTGWLTETMTNRAVYYVTEPETDLIVLADYATADDEMTLLSDLGFQLVEMESTEATPLPANGASAANADEMDVTETPAAAESEGQQGVETPQESSRPDGTLTPTPLPQEQADHPLWPKVQADETNVPSQSPAPTTTVNATQTAVPDGFPTEAPPGVMTFTPVPIETVIPAATIPATPTPTPAAVGATSEPSTLTATQSPTQSPTDTATPTPEPTPEIEVYLVREDGLRLVAAETVLIAQREMDDGRRVVSVLGYDSDGIRNGINRLLEEGFDGCVTDVNIAVCSNPEGKSKPTEASSSDATPTPTAGDEADTSDSALQDNSTVLVMVIDDNDEAQPDEEPEYTFYVDFLAEQGFGPTLWRIAEDGPPVTADLEGYDWVIWSAGGYEASGPGINDLQALMDFMNAGGALTISSQKPFFGMGMNAPSPILDVALDSGIPELVLGLPSTPITLPEPSPPVIPLEIGDEHAGSKIALRRGPASDVANAPLLYVMTDAASEAPTGAKLMVAGMSLTWLPVEYGHQLLYNITDYMLAD